MEFNSMTSSLQITQESLSIAVLSGERILIHGSPPYSGGSCTVQRFSSVLYKHEYVNMITCDNNGASGTRIERVTEFMSLLTLNQSSLVRYTPNGQQESFNRPALQIMAPNGQYIHTERQEDTAPTSLLVDNSWGPLPQLPIAAVSPVNRPRASARDFEQRRPPMHDDCHWVWSGTLPRKNYENPDFSRKVFLGGIPWDITEESLLAAIQQYGPLRVEWPASDSPKGYAYIIFKSEKQVKPLLQSCSMVNFSKGPSWYYQMSSNTMRLKKVQVIPWLLSDNHFTYSTTEKVKMCRTVYVGALHGLLNAEGLAKIMNDLFDGVIYTGIDTDVHQYPTGSGKVTFNNRGSYLRAVTAAFVEIRTARFTKQIQVDPYLEDSNCSKCQLQQGPLFCRQLSCMRYFCCNCWLSAHRSEGHKSHKPMTRPTKN